MLSNLIPIFQWWLVFFIIGLIFLPTTSGIFNKFTDRGYLFSKVLGLIFISYLILLLNVLHILPFGLFPILLVVWVCIISNLLIVKKAGKPKNLPLKIIIFEEIIFALGIIIWSTVRSYEPSINGLEKFMDFGFLNSILRTTWQPAVDMWLTPNPINYYYFGHLSTAVVTKLSLLSSNITYNLMIATLFAFTFSLSFSIGINFISKVLNKKAFLGGLLTAGLVAFAGNIHTIFAFLKVYPPENPVEPWKLPILFNSFPNSYWYPNATRFIPFTIHEFPIYSFVVSDLHGHVLDIPLVLLIISISFVIFTNHNSDNFLNFKIFKISDTWILKASSVLPAFILAAMYMTNVWDGLIYMVLIFCVVFIKELNEHKFKKSIAETAKYALPTVILFFIFTLPFNFYFKPFASGIGVVCSPGFLVNLKKFGPLLFEADHCQRSPLWQLAILYGFFYFFVVSFIVYVKIAGKKFKVELSDIFIFILILISTLLIIFPELFYVKDIYPAHYRANTMFKLVYQSFMMLSISSAYIIVRIISGRKSVGKIIFTLMTAVLLSLVFIYPYFAINSYYGEFKNYSGLDGTKYLATKYPSDYEAINWINKYIVGRPVIAEAQGDSYTDYARISANTGLPTILGWTVHEWLWHGSYDVPAPRIGEVKDLYETPDIAKAKKIVKKYDVKYIYVGDLEHQKYPDLNEDKFKKLGKVIFQNGNTKIYKVN